MPPVCRPPRRGVCGDRPEGRRGGPEEDVEDDLAVGERDLCDLPGQREHDVEVGNPELGITYLMPSRV